MNEPGQPDPAPVTANCGNVVFSCWSRLLTIDMAALYLGLSAKTIKNHGCRLPGRKKWGGKVVFDRHQLDKMPDRSRGWRSLWTDAERLCE